MHSGRTDRREYVTADPIIAELRRVRREIEAEHGGDWDALERYFVDKQGKAAEKQVAFKPKKLPQRKAM